jgi:hypothetical protein
MRQAGKRTIGKRQTHSGRFWLSMYCFCARVSQAGAAIHSVNVENSQEEQQRRRASERASERVTRRESIERWRPAQQQQQAQLT